MYSIKGKLTNGNNVTGNVGGTDAAAALASVVANLPEGTAFVSVTVKRQGSGSLKISAPRAKKETPAAAPAVAPAAAAPAVTVATPRKR